MSAEQLLPEGFSYPVGYIPPVSRISDPEILLRFQPVERPYVVMGHQGRPAVDPGAPMAIRRFQNEEDREVFSAVQSLRIEAEAGQSMEAHSRRREALEYASDLSEAGFHGAAIDLIRRMPRSYQRRPTMLEVLSNSLMAVSRYEEALVEIRELIKTFEARLPDEYNQVRFRLREITLLLSLGRLEESEKLMDEGRSELSANYEYYGCRAALALARNDEPLARALVLKAGRADTYHAYKILWHPALRPLGDFIKCELLTEEGEPLIYQQDGEMRLLIHRAQGALLNGEWERAWNIAEGFVLQRISSWDTAEEFILALVGFGSFSRVFEVAHVLPGRQSEEMVLARLISEAITKKTDAALSEVEKMIADTEHFEDSVRTPLLEVTKALANGKEVSPALLPKTLLVRVKAGWNDAGRTIFEIYHDVGGFQLVKLNESRSRSWPESLAVLETSAMDSNLVVEMWIEEKLAANAARAKDEFRVRVFKIDLEGWTLLSTLKASHESTPLLYEAWELARSDPNFYFHNGPAASFGLHTSFEHRLLRMMRLDRPKPKD